MVQHVKIVEAVKEILACYGYVAYLWHVEDVHFICEQNNLPRITNEEAMKVFAIASEQFDGENGISWPQIEQALRAFLRSKALLAKLCESDTESR